MPKKHVKILFEYQTPSGETELESLWAVPVKGGFRVDNIPFYVKEISCDDIVCAEREADGFLKFVALVRTGGHSTVRLWFARSEDVDTVRKELRGWGCSSEVDLERLVAVDIPKGVQYAKFRDYLDRGEEEGIFEYQEACIAHEL